MPGFLNYFCAAVGMVASCVYAPWAINNYSCKIKPEYLVKQVILLSGFYVLHKSVALVINAP